MAIHLENVTRRLVNPIFFGDDGKPDSLVVVPGKLSDEGVAKKNEITADMLKRIEARPENRILFEGPDAALRVHGAQIKFPAKKAQVA